MLLAAVLINMSTSFKEHLLKTRQIELHRKCGANYLFVFEAGHPIRVMTIECCELSVIIIIVIITWYF